VTPKNPLPLCYCHTVNALNTKLEIKVENYQPGYSSIHKRKRYKTGRKERNIYSVSGEYRIKENRVDNDSTKLSFCTQIYEKYSRDGCNVGTDLSPISGGHKKRKKFLRLLNYIHNIPMINIITIIIKSDGIYTGSIHGLIN
jgi:hypothetical protein